MRATKSWTAAPSKSVFPSVFFRIRGLPGGKQMAQLGFEFPWNYSIGTTWESANAALHLDRVLHHLQDRQPLWPDRRLFFPVIVHQVRIRRAMMVSTQEVRHTHANHTRIRPTFCNKKSSADPGLHMHQSKYERENELPAERGMTISPPLSRSPFFYPYLTTDHSEQGRPRLFFRREKTTIPRPSREQGSFLP